MRREGLQWERSVSDRDLNVWITDISAAARQRRPVSWSAVPTAHRSLVVRRLLGEQDQTSRNRSASSRGRTAAPEGHMARDAAIRSSVAVFHRVVASGRAGPKRYSASCCRRAASGSRSVITSIVRSRSLIRTSAWLKQSYRLGPSEQHALVSICRRRHR